jgi:hypothetical protein
VSRFTKSTLQPREPRVEVVAEAATPAGDDDDEPDREMSHSAA